MSIVKYFLFIWIFIGCTSSAFSQNHKNFKHLSPRVDNRTITVIKTTQDAIGNIWMVYTDGVLVYDGYNYRQIKNTTIFKNIKKNDNISDIITDTNKNIWILSEFGLLTKYSSNTGKFVTINQLLKKDEAIAAIVPKEKKLWMVSKKGYIYCYASSKIVSTTAITNITNIKDIVSSKNKNLFISTKDGKLYNYNLKAKKLSEISGPYSNYPGGLILTADTDNKLWIGTEAQGLFVYDITTKQFIQDSFFKQQKYNINKELFITLFSDNNGFVWGGTDGGGLYQINSVTGKIKLFAHQNTNEYSLSSNTILNISEDNHKNLWVSTNYGDLNILQNTNQDIYYHQGSANGSPQRILCIYKSKTGDLWAGTDGAGLTRISYKEDGTTNERQYFNHLDFNKGFYIQSITEDKLQNLWLGTYKNGLWHYNLEEDSFKKIKIINSKQQEATDIRIVYTDSKNRIWIGSNVAITVFDSKLNVIATFENNSNGIKGTITESIIENTDGTIWFGQYNGGLFSFKENQTNFKESTFDQHLYYTDDKKNEFHSIRSMAIGKKNQLWLVNHYGKLIDFNTATKAYNTFEHLETINNQGFAAVIAEDKTNVWMSSNNGIYHWNTTDMTVKTYYSTDGLQDNMFLSRSVHKDRDGIFYFGGITGLNYFNPKHLIKDISTATLHINAIEVLNQSAEALIPTQITSGISNVTHLQLKYNQSSFLFKFSAIDNILNPKYYYAYRLKGFDNKWITNHNERIATYTNIPAGEYTFEVKAGTKKGVWNIPIKQITISIAQPIWNSYMAYFIYLLLLALIAYGLKRWYFLRKKLLLEKISHKNENELHELKMNFFAKMSHEIQTPITLILGPIEDMLKRSEENGNLLLKQRLSIISYNTKRLSKIARDLTLVRNKELGRLKLNVTENRLDQHIENISLSFRELARKKQIDFIVNYPKNLSESWYDKEKIEHIIYNLLSNAFKFTPKEGNIQLNVIPINAKKSIKIIVTDSGTGIPNDELSNIFELFYQSKSGRKNKGSGIGLALTKDLIDLQKGTIEVNSTPIEGTTFIVVFPIDKNAYADTEKIVSSETNAPHESSVATKEYQNNQKKHDPSKKTILIVEDNYDLQSFLKDLLYLEYNILLADNGEEGLLYAKNNFPDLILSDIMMPKLNGIDLTKKLQEDRLTKHIPIILLTAKNSTNSKILGLESGAIEYINKPFNTNELLLKIKNIISSKEHIISKYRKEIISKPKVNQEQTQDEIFLSNIVSKINSRLEDPNFKIEELADSLHMGYSTLYRKCQSLTGHSLVDFVRLLRLKKAALLITKYGYNISEASFMTGFNDPKYFSKCFKKQFKKTPGLFKKEAQKIGVATYLKKHQLD